LKSATPLHLYKYVARFVSTKLKARLAAIRQNTLALTVTVGFTNVGGGDGPYFFLHHFLLFSDAVL